MRIAILTATLLSLSLVGAAQAKPASVAVQIGPELRIKANKIYGLNDVQRLAEQLQRQVTKQVSRTGAFEDARVELVLADALPNHPTFKQLGDRPGLSMRSFGIGGATIEGRIVAADGTVTPLRYSYYEPDIRFSRGRSTWGDAEWTVDRFAYRLGQGEAIRR